MGGVGNQVEMGHSKQDVFVCALVVVGQGKYKARAVW